MTSWRIWRILMNPPFWHPLFRRTLLNRASLPSHPTSSYRSHHPKSRMILEVMTAIVFCSAMCSPLFLVAACATILFVLNGTGYSAIWAVQTSGVIAREREFGTYDLHCLSPEGALGVNWALCTGFLHRGQQLEQVHGLIRSILTIGLVIAGIMAMVLVTNIVRTPDNSLASEGIQNTSAMLVNVLALIAIIYIDHIQSVVLGILVSIFVPTYSRGHIDAQLATFGLFLFLQITTYLLFWLVGLVLLPALYQGTDGIIAQVSLACLQVGSFYTIREGIITYLWRLLARRLDIPASEESAIRLSMFKPGLKLQ